MALTGTDAPRVIVAGSVNADVAVVSKRLPSLGETLGGAEVRLFPGGKGANQAVGAARFGARTRFIGRVGRDAFASVAISSLVESGVDVTELRVCEDASTGVAIVLVEENGANRILLAPGANARFTARDVEDLEVSPGDVLIAQLEIPLETVERFAAVAASRGATLILNAAPALRLPPRLLEHVDVLVLNESELAFYANVDPAKSETRERTLELAAALCALPKQRVVVTLGENGAVAAGGGDTFDVPGRRVPVVDTTGAGDCFTGVLGAALAGAASFAEALHLANVAASLSVGRPGAAPSMPARSEIVTAA